MGVVFFVIYFLLFSVNPHVNLKTPGREDKVDDVVTEEANSNTEEGFNPAGDQLHRSFGRRYG